MAWSTVGWSGTAQSGLDRRSARRRGKARAACAGQQGARRLRQQREARLDHWTHFHRKPLVFLSLKAVVSMQWGRGNLEDVEERAELPRNRKGC